MFNLTVLAWTLVIFTPHFWALKNTRGSEHISPLGLTNRMSSPEWLSQLALMNLTTWSWVWSEMSRPLMRTTWSPSLSRGTHRSAWGVNSRWQKIRKGCFTDFFFKIQFWVLQEQEVWNDNRLYFNIFFFLFTTIYFLFEGWTWGFIILYSQKPKKKLKKKN